MQLNDEQVNKFRALGTAAKGLAAEYKTGKGPDPISGTTFRNGAPCCTWGQLLDKAGMKATGGTSDNVGALDAFIRGSSTFGSTTLLTGPSVQAIKDGMFVDKKVTYDITKVKAIAQEIMQANDPCSTPEARKAATWQILDKLSGEIDKVFGLHNEEDGIQYFGPAAEQYLENLVLGNE